MKTLHLSIIVIFFIGLLLVPYLKPIQAGNTNDIEIQNIQVKPSTVKVGETFSINATLVNNSTNSIAIEHGACEGPFSVVFDNHVKVNVKYEACILMLILQKINPGEKITGTSPPPLDVTYRATTAGIANATVTFSYEMWDQTSQSNIRKTISKSFSFTIYDNNTVSKPVNRTALSPLEQLKSGIPIEDIQCKQPLILFFKAEDQSLACLTVETAEKLSQRKWLDTSTPSDIVRKKTKEFVLSSPSFMTFGIEKTLLLDQDFTCDLNFVERCFTQAFYDATRPGYGNGTNPLSPTNQTIHHNVAIRIYDSNQVECAVIDGTWDEKNQRPLDKNDKGCGNLFGFKGGFP